MPPFGDEAGSEIDQMNSSLGNATNSTYLMMPKRDPLYIVVPMTIMYSVIFVTGVIGNSITCMVIAKHKYMHTATNYYLFSLAVSDLILLVSGLPQEMWSIWSKYPYVFGEIFCQLRGLFSEMSANATVLTITAFTAERYVAICHPFMAQSMSKLSRAVKLIVIIWLVAVLFAIPQALQFTVSPLDTPSKDVTCNLISVQLTDGIELSTVSFTLSTVLFFVLPMTLITVLYALIGLRLRRSDKLKRTITVRSSKGEKKISSPEYRANSSSKVLKMLVAVVVAFFICWAPFHAQRLLAIFGSSTFGPDTPLLHQLYGISTYVSGVLYYLSTTINPILYHIMSLKFRSAFKETVLRCCGRDERRGRGGEQRRRGRWRTKHRRRRRRRDGSSSAAPAGADDDDGCGGGGGGGGGHDGYGRPQQKYRRVSGQASSSSVRLPPAARDVGHRIGGGGGCERVDAAAAADTAFWRRLTAACWRRESDGSSSGSYSVENGCGSTTPLAAGHAGHRCPAVAPMALSNWTVISNSSLKDVDGDDLRDELVGYAAAAAAAADAMTSTTATTTTTTGGDDDDDHIEIVIADAYQ